MDDQIKANMIGARLEQLRQQEYQMEMSLKEIQANIKVGEKELKDLGKDPEPMGAPGPGMMR